MPAQRNVARPWSTVSHYSTLLCSRMSFLSPVSGFFFETARAKMPWPRRGTFGIVGGKARKHRQVSRETLEGANYVALRCFSYATSFSVPSSYSPRRQDFADERDPLEKCGWFRNAKAIAGNLVPSLEDRS